MKFKVPNPRSIIHVVQWNSTSKNYLQSDLNWISSDIFESEIIESSNSEQVLFRRSKFRSSNFCNISFWRMVEIIRGIMSAVLFYQFICCSAVIASSLRAFERYSDTISFDLVLAFAPMAIELSIIIVYCSYSDNVTSDVAKIGHLFYDLLWYEMNVREQKCVTLAIQRAQKLIPLSGYGVFNCSYERLMKVGTFLFFLHFFMLSTPSPLVNLPFLISPSLFPPFSLSSSPFLLSPSSFSPSSISESPKESFLSQLTTFSLVFHRLSSIFRD